MSRSTARTEAVAYDFGALQFGAGEEGVAYRDRPAAFGLALRDGKLACVEVRLPGEAPFWDLPGGAIDPGEGPREAVIREFHEETGLAIIPLGEPFACASQRFRKADHEPGNNLCAFFEVEAVSEDPSGKIEDDHTLQWREPEDLLKRLRHDAHAWAVAKWLRGA